jgi:hypothetical protein
VALEIFGFLSDKYKEIALEEMEKTIKIFKDTRQLYKRDFERGVVLIDSMIFYLNSLIWLSRGEVSSVFPWLLMRIQDAFADRDIQTIFRCLGYLSIYLKNFRKYGSKEQQEELIQLIGEEFSLTPEGAELLSEQLILGADGLSTIPATTLPPQLLGNVKAIMESMPGKIRECLNIVLTFFQGYRLYDGCSSEIRFDSTVVVGVMGEVGDHEQIFLHELGHLVHKNSIAAWEAFKRLFQQSHREEDFLESLNPRNPEYCRKNFLEDFTNSFSRYFMDSIETWREVQEKGSEVVKEKFKVILSLFSFEKDGRKYAFIYQVQRVGRSLRIRRTSVLLDEEGMPIIPAAIPEGQWEIFEYPVSPPL